MFGEMYLPGLNRRSSTHALKIVLRLRRGDRIHVWGGNDPCSFQRLQGKLFLERSVKLCLVVGRRPLLTFRPLFCDEINLF